MSQRKKSFIRVLVLALAGAVVGAGIGYLLGGHLKPLVRRSDIGDVSLWVMLPMAFVSLFATFVVHELGHLIAAQLAGFRFRVLTLGPLSMIDTPKGFRYRMSFRVLGAIGGQQISSPPREGASSAGFLLYLAGGGVANILTGLLAYGLLHLSLPGMLKMFCIMFGLFSVFLGVLNLLPFRMTGGIATDGYNIRSILRGGAAANHFRAMFELIADVYSGVRPRDWRPEIVELLRVHGEGYERALGLVTHMQWAMDRGDANAAASSVVELERRYEGIPSAFRSHYAVELAHWFALKAMPPDATKVERYAADTEKGGYLLSQSAIYRARALRALVAGGYAEALRHCDEGLSAVAHGMTELDRTLEPELLEKIKAKAKQSLARAA